MPIKTVVLFCLVNLVKNSIANINDVLFSGSYEFVDLTYPFDNQTVYWPNSQNFDFTKKTEEYRQDGSWYASNDFKAGEHGGTHIDAPYHFDKTGLYAGELPLENLIVPLIVADVSSKVSDDPNFVLRKQDLDYMINDNMGKPCVLIFKFGWGKYFTDRNKYLGIEGNNRQLNFPGLSGEVAEWITTYKNIVGVGVDVASVDPGSSKDFPVHRIFSRNGLYSIENVNFSKDIPDAKIKLLDWKGHGINVNGEYLTHLRFADDVVLMAETLEDLNTMLADLSSASERVGLKMNMDKTKIMSSAHVVPAPVNIRNTTLEVVDHYVYLGHTVQLDYGCTALVLPMKIALGTGAPLRLVAICPKRNN